MGVAAYWRGSRAISEQFAREAYQAGRSGYNPDAIKPQPTPRPVDWGEKTAARALDLARRRIAAAKMMAELREEPFTWTEADTEASVYQLHERYRIGRETLRAAFEHHRQTP